MCIGTTRRGDKNNFSTLPPLIPHCHGSWGWDRAVGTEPCVSGLPGTAASSAIPITSARPLPAAGGQSRATATTSCSQTASPALPPPSPKTERPLCAPHPALLPTSSLQPAWNEQGFAEEPCRIENANLEMLDLIDVGTLPTHSNIHVTIPWQGRAALVAFTRCLGG